MLDSTQAPRSLDLSSLSSTALTSPSHLSPTSSPLFPKVSRFEKSSQQAPNDEQAEETVPDKAWDAPFWEGGSQLLEQIPEYTDQTFMPNNPTIHENAKSPTWSTAAKAGGVEDDDSLGAFRTWELYHEPFEPLHQNSPILDAKLPRDLLFDHGLPPFDPLERSVPWIERREIYYDFVVTKTEAFWKLKLGYRGSDTYPDRIISYPICDPVSNAREKIDKRYPCGITGCMAKPFTRHYDLERHFCTAHAIPPNMSNEIKVKGYRCDYANCQRRVSGFSRKDYCKMHYREFHEEDLVEVKHIFGQDEITLDHWWRTRKIESAWWRCSRCLEKKITIEGWKCKSCNLECEPERQAVRKKLIAVPMNDDKIRSGDLMMSGLPQRQASPSYLMANTAYPAPRLGFLPRLEARPAVAVKAQEANIEPIGSGKIQVQGTNAPYQRPKHTRVPCTQCEDYPEGFRGMHELQRHIDRNHKTMEKKWVCAEPSDGLINWEFLPQTSLGQCKACSTEKKYGAYYIAAAHLRIAHFLPKSRHRGANEVENQPKNRGGKGRGDWPPMSELKRWMKEVDVPILPVDGDYLSDASESECQSQINSPPWDVMDDLMDDEFKSVLVQDTGEIPGGLRTDEFIPFGEGIHNFPSRGSIATTSTTFFSQPDVEIDPYTEDIKEEATKNDTSPDHIQSLPTEALVHEKPGLGHDTKTVLGAATDSGYASLGVERHFDEANPGEDDNMSVFTDYQDLEIADDIKENLVSAFSSEIIHRLEAFLGTVDKNRSLGRQLSGLLKDFSIRLCNTANLGQQKDATVFVRHYRNRIANSLEVSIKQFSLSNDLAHEYSVEEEEEEEEKEEGNPLESEKGFTLQEKMQKLMWDAPDANHAGDEILNHSDAEEEDDRDRDDYAITHFADAWKFLTESHAYEWLLGRVSALLLTSSKDSLSEQIGLNAKTGHRKYKDVCEAHFYILDWPLLNFLKEQYPSEEDVQLGSVITLTGSGIDAQALSCAEYMRQIWPTTGIETLRAMQRAVNMGEGKSLEYVMSDGTQIKITVLDAEVRTSVKGGEPAVAEVGQQLAWLGSALRAAPSPERMAYCMPKVTALVDKRSTFAISFSLLDIQPSHADIVLNGACWRNLFRNPVVVEGYPILARLHGEKGLELPLNMMATLGDASRVTNFDGGLLAKGFSTLFAPIKRIKDSVQWHYLFEQDGRRISYLAADTQCPDRARIDKVDSSCLQFSRNFLGWTSSVEIFAGAKDVNYDDIDWPGTNLAPAGVAFEKASIILGNYVTGGASFTRGNKDTPIYLRRGGPYEQEIHFASRMKVVLYDVGDRRGWLVDGANALLHITRTQLALSPYSDSDLFKVEDFHHADPTGGVNAAKKALLNPKNRELSIFEDIEVSVESSTAKEEVRKTTKRWTYQDLVRQTYHILEQIHDYETKMLTSPTIALYLTDRERLMGFAFMDIVDGQNDLRPRLAVLKSSGKGWVDFTRSIRAITLLGKGFGEIFRPSKDSNDLCKRWKTVPTGKDYLVACSSMLKDICKRHGSHDTKPMELAHGIYWHKPDKLFEPCECNCIISSGSCDRVQVLLPPSLGSKRHPQPFGHQNGAVIFGRSKRFPWRWPGKGDPVQGQSDSEVDESSGFHDSGLGSSRLSQSDSNDSGRVDSNISISSDPAPCLESREIIMSGTLEHDVDHPIQQNPEPIASTGMQNLSPSRYTFQKQSMGINHQQMPPPSGATYDQGTSPYPATHIPEFQRPNLHNSLQGTQDTEPRQGKRSWDKMKEMTPRLFPKKRPNES